MAPGKSYLRWGARTAAAAVFCLAGALVGTGLYFVNLAYVGPLSSTTCSKSGLTLVLRAAGECVGVTDGSYVFAPPLQKVEGMIEAENRRVRSTGPNYVSMAYLLPLSVTGGAEPVKAETEQLEGAYAAQYYANRHNVQGTAPKIQLLVASSGTNAAGYSTTDKIIEGDVAAQRLVAVAGIGISTSNTLAEVSNLTSNGITVIGSTITSDIFDNIPGLVRVAPSETQQINAALAYIKPIARTAVLFEDTNPADSYTTTLAADFRRDFSDKTHSIGAAYVYSTAGDINDSGPVAAENVNQIRQIVPQICATHPDVVLFAGRGPDIAMLISDLEIEPCSFPVTIVTGDDAANMPNIPLVSRALQGKVKLDYAGEASPSQWDHSPAGSAYKGVPRAVIQQGRQGFSQFGAAFSGNFPLASAGDGNAMMGYDATLASITSIRLAGASATTATVAQELPAIQGHFAVSGASGPIIFSADYNSLAAHGSNPVGKLVPILQLPPNGTPRFIALEP